MVDSTKDLEVDRQGALPISQALSVIIFRIILEGIERYRNDPEGEDRMATEAVRKLLPLLRTLLSKEAKLSINGLGIMTVVIRAEQQEAKSVAQHTQEIIQATPVRVGMAGREVKVTGVYSLLTFPLKAYDESATTVSHPQVYEPMGALQTTWSQGAL